MWKTLPTIEDISARIEARKIYYDYAETLILKLRIQPQLHVSHLLGQGCTIDNRQAIAMWVRDHCFDHKLRLTELATLRVLAKELDRLIRRSLIDD